MASVFKRGEIARLVTNQEVSRLTTDGLLYGAAAVISEHGSIVQHIQPSAPPIDLLDGQRALLIKTTDTLAISYLCSTQHRNVQNSYGISTRPVMYQISKNGKTANKLLRCKLSLRFNLNASDLKLCETVHRIMAERGKERLSKKDFLKAIAYQYEDQAVDLIAQPFATEHYQPGALAGQREVAQIQDSAEQTLSAEFADSGLRFSNAVFSIDGRPFILRYTLPSFTHDSNAAIIVKFITAPAATVIGTLLRVFGIITWP